MTCHRSHSPTPPVSPWSGITFSGVHMVICQEALTVPSIQKMEDISPRVLGYTFGRLQWLRGSLFAQKD